MYMCVHVNLRFYCKSDLEPNSGYYTCIRVITLIPSLGCLVQFGCTAQMLYVKALADHIHVHVCIHVTTCNSTFF